MDDFDSHLAIMAQEINLPRVNDTNNAGGSMTITNSALQQREALRILSQMKTKPIIAVDLDYTVHNKYFYRSPHIRTVYSSPLTFLIVFPNDN